jgi:regulatory protein
MDLKTAIYRYCNYQERCHKQVRNKLYDLGATTTEVQQLITDVIEAGLLNEERYARSFARGKFRIKRWGRIKIRQHLKADQVSDYCIKKAMLEIDGDEYTTVLLRLAEKKWNELERENVSARKMKTFRYLLQKGFEADFINDTLKEIISPG